MIKIAICDDESIFTANMEDMLIKIGKKNTIEIDINVFFDGSTLEKSFLRGERFDLIYLDIEMKTINGIEAAKNIRGIDQDVLIIYVSGYENHMKELFEVDAFRFISKPIDSVIFENYFIKAYERLCACATYFEFQYNREITKILIGDIIYFESHGRTINISLVNGEEKYNGKINDIEKTLKKCKIAFLRIHQSYLVSYKFIKCMSMTNVTLLNGRILQISEDRQKAIRKQYCSLLGGEISD